MRNDLRNRSGECADICVSCYNGTAGTHILQNAYPQLDTIATADGLRLSPAEDTQNVGLHHLSLDTVGPHLSWNASYIAGACDCHRPSTTGCTSSVARWNKTTASTLVHQSIIQKRVLHIW
jgi:hypothetical protein